MSYNKMGSGGGGGGFLDGQLDMGGAGGKLWECWKVEPCCDGYCCVTWWCCGLCNTGQLYAWSNDQKCALVNHCCILSLCYCVTIPSMRYTIRKKAGVAGGGPMDGFVADCLVSYFCGACAGCQELRAAHGAGGKASWDYFANPIPEVFNSEIKIPPLMG